MVPHRKEVTGNPRAGSVDDGSQGAASDVLIQGYYAK